MFTSQAMSERRRSLHRPARRHRPDRRVGLRDQHARHEARPRPAGRRPAHLRGPADGSAADRHAGGARAVAGHHARPRRRLRRGRARAAAGGREPDRGQPPGRGGRRARGADQVGSTAQLFFYDWEASILDENCQTDPDENASAKQPVTGFYNAVKRASRCDPQADGNNNSADARFYAATRSPSSRYNDGQPSESRKAALEDLSDEQRSNAEVLEVPEGILVVRDESRRRRRGPRPLLGDPGQPGAVGHRHPQPGAELRRPDARADRHLRLHGRGP